VSCSRQQQATPTPPSPQTRAGGGLSHSRQQQLTSPSFLATNASGGGLSLVLGSRRHPILRPKRERHLPRPKYERHGLTSLRTTTTSSATATRVQRPPQHGDDKSATTMGIVTATTA
jgi:hypothetical protein